VKRIVLVALLGLLVSGCATVTRGTTSQVELLSEPPGAEARTSLGHACVTPCTLQFNRKDEFTVTFSKPGYREQQVDVTTRVAGAGAAGFVGNVVVGGVVGMGVDAFTGSTLEHVPNPVSVELQRLSHGAPPRAVRPRPPRPAAPREPAEPTS
jgi:hypothetical protein